MEHSTSLQKSGINCHVNFNELLEQSCLRDPFNPSLCNHCNRKIAAHPRKPIQPSEELWICGLYIEELLAHDWTRYSVDRLKCCYCGQLVPNHPRRPFFPKIAPPRSSNIDSELKRQRDPILDGGAGAGALLEMNPPAKRLSIQSSVAATSEPPQAHPHPHPQTTPHILANRITQVTPDNALLTRPEQAPQVAVASTTTTLPSKVALRTDKPVTSVPQPDSNDQAIPCIASSAIQETSATKTNPPVDPTQANFKSPWSKCVEQLDLETGEVLRVYPSGWYAAKILSVSQGGISQCMNGLRQSCYGFRWRAYDGPPLDFAAIESRQKPIEDLRNMIVIRGIKRGAEKGEHSEEAPTKEKDLPAENPTKYVPYWQPKNYSSSGAKCVEQFDLATKAALRVYPSGTNAASLMQISTTGISLCINGQRNEYYGYGWRFYTGPDIIDFAAIEDKQTPVDKLFKMRVIPKCQQPKAQPAEKITVTPTATPTTADN